MCIYVFCLQVSQQCCLDDLEIISDVITQSAELMSIENPEQHFASMFQQMHSDDLSFIFIRCKQSAATGVVVAIRCGRGLLSQSAAAGGCCRNPQRQGVVAIRGGRGLLSQSAGAGSCCCNLQRQRGCCRNPQRQGGCCPK